MNDEHYGAPPMFEEGAIISAGYHPDRGKYNKSVLGRIVERDGHTLVVEELDHQGERDNKHRRVRLHAPSREATSLTEHRETSLGTIHRIDFYASAETAADAPGANVVNAAMNAHIHDRWHGGSGHIIHEERGVYRYPESAVDTEARLDE